ncbi:stage II sporulation protein M [Candidatus Woesearchaeota archaeon]|nr:stage II sporulation protein M [Candidatus Woesearchaeota archaeon]
MRAFYRARFDCVGVLGIILMSAVAGFYFPGLFGEAKQEIVQEIVGLTAGKGFLELALVIVANNLRVAAVGILLGVFFGVVPVVAAVFNGYFMGVVLRDSWSGFGPGIFLFLVPHGVFEIPALALSFALGFRLGFWFRVTRKSAWFASKLKDYAAVFAYIIAPLLVAAGFIESYLIHFL